MGSADEDDLVVGRAGETIGTKKRNRVVARILGGGGIK